MHAYQHMRIVTHGTKSAGDHLYHSNCIWQVCSHEGIIKDILATHNVITHA